MTSNIHGSITYPPNTKQVVLDNSHLF